MRTSWVVSCGLGTLLLVLLGCRNTGPDLRPPKQPDVYNLPPQGDPRFENPPVYPTDPNSSDGRNKRGDSSGPSMLGKGGRGGAGGMAGY